MAYAPIIITLIVGILLGVGIATIAIRTAVATNAELTVVNKKDILLSLTRKDMDSLQVRKWALVRVNHVNQ